MFDVFENRLELVGTLKTITALRISQGRSLEPIGADLPVVKDALGRPLIPGSSFKGAMRSRLESFLRGVDPSLAANPAIEEEWAIPFQDVREGATRIEGMTSLKKRIDENSELNESEKDQRLTQEIIERTDIASLLFGSPWMASKFQVRDLTVDANNWFGQYQERDGVAIDRDTETASDGKLYSFQVVPAGTPFEFRTIVENAEDWELGLLMIGLHQFETQQIPLGGGRSRGLGVVELAINNAWWFECADGSPAELIDYMQRLVTGDREPYHLDSNQFAERKSAWAASLIHELRRPEAERFKPEAANA